MIHIKLPHGLLTIQPEKVKIARYAEDLVIFELYEGDPVIEIVTEEELQAIKFRVKTIDIETLPRAESISILTDGLDDV